MPMVTPDQVAQLADERALSLGLLVVSGGFYLGELVVAVALLRARVIARWVPVMLLLHAASAPVTQFLPAQVQGLEAVVLGMGLMGIAVKSTERWADSRPPTPL